MTEASAAVQEATAPSEGLTLGQAIAVGVNTTSPAFSLAAILAPMAALVGYSTPVVLLVSFIPMALTSLAFLFLNRRDPDCGTTFSWVTRAIGAKSGFIAGWVIAATGVIVIGSLAETAITYGLPMFGQDSLAASRSVVIAGAAVLIIIMTVLAVIGSDSSIRLQSVLTFLQIGILVAFGILAAYTAWRHGLPRFSADWVNPLSQGVEPLVGAMLLGVFAFWGWEAATNLSEECRNPADAGKAGLLSTAILVATYVIVAISVVLYLGQSDFYPVGDSGLVLVDMAGPVFGPLSFLVLLAVASSAVASTQSTMVPGSRAVLSMARRGALPARMGLMHPRFKTPWVSIATLAAIACGWYVLVSTISESALQDSLSSLGILVAFYYSITGLACVAYYRRHVTASLRGFVMVGLGPTIGALGLLAILVVAVRSLWDPASSATGSAWLGLSPPLAMAALVVIAGGAVMLFRRAVAPAFFRASRPETAGILTSPFVLDAERAVPHGGVVVDCNDSAENVNALLMERISRDLDRATPIYLVFGIRPAEMAGEEYAAVRHVLESDGHALLTSIRVDLQRRGMTSVHRFYVDAHSRESLTEVADAMDARAMWSQRAAYDSGSTA